MFARNPAEGFMFKLSSIVAFVALVCSIANAASYKQVAKYTLGGEGGWDYLTFDPDASRIFIAHNKEILVADAGTGKQIGSVPADGAHGVALANGKGFS